MADCGRTHSFRGHAVAGVSWRPTRFVEAVPTSRVCDLCLMIPKRIVLLPCVHTVCQSCCPANSRRRRCPLDQKLFEENECNGYDFSTKEASVLKVCCWNEGHGCKFEGSVESMLWHYENECTSHVIECSRCGKGVLHKNLSTHHVAECIPAVSSASKYCPSPENVTQEVQDAIANVEYMQALLGDPKPKQLLSSIQGQMTELTEQVRTQQSKLDEISRGVAASEQNLKAEIAKVAVTVRSAMFDQPRSQNPTEEAGASSSSPVGSETIYRKLEIFADTSLHTLEQLRQFSAREGVRCATTVCESVGLGRSDWYLQKAQATVPTWTAFKGQVKYTLTIKNCDEDTLSPLHDNIAQVTVLHMRDAYFTAQICRVENDLIVRIAFHGMLADSPCSTPSLTVWALCALRLSKAILPLIQEHSCCAQHGDALVHFHQEFRGKFDYLKNNGFIEDKQIKLLIEVSHITAVRVTITSPKSA